MVIKYGNVRGVQVVGEGECRGRGCEGMGSWREGVAERGAQEGIMVKKHNYNFD